jgi:hypothetical protein
VKKWKMWVLTIVLLSMLCACRSAPRAFIPLMKVSNLGECRLCKWDTEKNEIVDSGYCGSMNRCGNSNPHFSFLCCIDPVLGIRNGPSFD